MKYEEIIEILKEKIPNIEDFAYDEIPYADFSEEANKSQVEKEEWIKNNPNPGYAQPGYKEWQKAYDYIPSKWDIARRDWMRTNNIPEWTEIEQVGGEGEGDHWHSVKYFKDHDVYIKVIGFYSSYHGTDFSGYDCCYNVAPKEKTITVYE